MAQDPWLEETEGRSGFDPVEIIRIFIRRKWLFLVPFVLCLGMAYVAIKTMPPVYYSAGMLRVIRESTVSRTINEGIPRYGRPRDMDRETLALITSIVTSPRFLEKVVRDLNLQHDPRLRDPELLRTVTMTADEKDAVVAALADRLVGMIRVEIAETHIFTIGVRHQDPELAFRLAKEIIDRFLEEEQASRLEKRATARDFLARQRVIYAKDLEEKQKRLTDYQRSIVAATLAGNPVTEQNLGQADDLLARLRQQRQEALQVDVATLREELSREAPVLLDQVGPLRQDPAVASTLRELVELEYDQVTDLLSGRTVSQESQQLLGSTRLALDQRILAWLGRHFPDLSPSLRARADRYLYASLYDEVNRQVIDRLAGHIRDYRDFMTRQPEQSATLARLQREVENAQNLLQALDQDITREELSMAASMSEIGYRIIVHRDPTLPRAPVEPNKPRLAMIGFGLALAIGVGLVLLATMLDRSFKTVEEIERSLGVKVIGTLPLIKERPFARRRRRRILLWVIIVLAILLLSAVGFLYVYPHLI